MGTAPLPGHPPIGVPTLSGRHPAGRGRQRPALNGVVHASAACAVPFRYVCDVPDQGQRVSSQRSAVPFTDVRHRPPHGQTLPV